MTETLVLRGGLLATYEATLRRWRFARRDIAIEDGIIAEVRECLPAAGPNTLDLAGAIVLPAFTNAHTHSFEYALKGFKSGRGIDAPHPPWFWELYDAFPESLALLGSEIHYAENIAAGVGTVGDVLRTGLRAAPYATALGGMGLRGIVFDDDPAGAAVDLGHEAHDSFAERAVSAARYGRRRAFHMHYLETPLRRERSRGNLGKTCVQFLEEAGLLTHRWILTHCGAATLDDLGAFPPDTLVVTTPVAEAWLDDITIDPALLEELGIAIGVGSDGPCYNVRVDLFEELRRVLLLYPCANLDQLLFAATLGPQAQLAPDAGVARADFAIIDAAHPGFHPLVSEPYDNQLANILHTASSRDVIGTIVAGKLLYWRGEWLQHDIRSRQRVLEKQVKGFLSDCLGGTARAPTL